MKRATACIRAVMLGHAVGDALGVPVEFSERDALDQNPVTDMRGYGAHDVPAGTWSDDTSMSLAALDSLCKARVDWDEILSHFCLWLEQARYTATGEVFDAGRTCVHALVRYARGSCGALSCGERDEYSNGNGSLMRIHPFVLYAHAIGLSEAACISLVHTASALTHAHERSLIACGIYAFVQRALIDDPCKDAVRRALEKARAYYEGYPEISRYARLFAPDFAQTPRGMIQSTGYVVDTLEAALWSLLTTDDYRACVLKAVNLGGDTDTVAAVAGGLAGALYGEEAIPTAWLDTLQRRSYIEELCTRAATAWGNG